MMSGYKSPVKSRNRCNECHETISGSVLGFNFNKKRNKCCECLNYVCPNCYASTTKRCNMCHAVSITRFNYTAISSLPIKVLKAYVREVVGMTPVDINRSLTEKTDFVDKILQFKGIQAQKTDYHAKIHHTATDVSASRSTPVSTSNDRIPDPNTESGTPLAGTQVPPQGHHIGDESPLLRDGRPSRQETVSPRSSISTDSDGFPMVENESLDDDEMNADVGQTASERTGVEDAMSVSETLTESAREASENSHVSSHISELPDRERHMHSSTSTPKHNPAESEDPQIRKLQNYSVKELKNFLLAHNVNFQGVVEKHELLAKAIRLVKDKQNNAKIFKEQTDSPTKTANEPDQDEKDVCKICWDATIDCVLLECGHMCTCTGCAKKLNECPICREHVVRCVHVFRV